MAANKADRLFTCEDVTKLLSDFGAIQNFSDSVEDDDEHRAIQPMQQASEQLSVTESQPVHRGFLIRGEMAYLVGQLASKFEDQESSPSLFKDDNDDPVDETFQRTDNLVSSSDSVEDDDEHRAIQPMHQTSEHLSVTESQPVHRAPYQNGAVSSDPALRSAGTLLLRVRAPPPASWPDGGPESLRSPCCGLAIYKTQPPIKTLRKGGKARYLGPHK
ncbi:hypothetical protein PoB_002572800 [Plakobranchus ocellatus]|uniref:Uncharacterized protein n=1 Tax=Plakobranchus ocellatus TaxID=259542 RepID=A0AAV3ZXQ3_9GAST|nr:hypothetical protein PoB_002572800 [Plakobranchus ocellatus]